jgi:albonoursin synthase
MPDSPVLDAILTRRSVRAYRREPVPREVLEALATAGLWAPTASNRQDVTFAVVDDPADLAALQPFAPGMRGDPPAVIAVCADLRRLPAVVGGDPVTAVVHMDVAMAAQNVLLAAHEAGLGACVIHSFRPAAVAGLLRLPAHLLPSLLIALGYPARTPPPPRRRPLGDVLLWGRQNSTPAATPAPPASEPSSAAASEPAAPAPRPIATATDPTRDGTLQAIWLLSTARGLLDEPLRYGPMRLLDAACRFVEYLKRRGLAEQRVTGILAGLERQREKGSAGYGELGAALDAALAELAEGM